MFHNFTWIYYFALKILDEFQLLVLYNFDI